MTKKELIEMLKDIPNEANVKIGGIKESLFGRDITYANINGFYKLTNIDYVLTDMNVQPRITSIQ